jgi:hypothetical protein
MSNAMLQGPLERTFFDGDRVFTSAKADATQMDIVSSSATSITEGYSIYFIKFVVKKAF